MWSIRWRKKKLSWAHVFREFHCRQYDLHGTFRHLSVFNPRHRTLYLAAWSCARIAHKLFPLTRAHLFAEKGFYTQKSNAIIANRIESIQWKLTLIIIIVHNTYLDFRSNAVTVNVNWMLMKEIWTSVTNAFALTVTDFSIIVIV